jgi:hypothetical protein
MTDGKVIRRTWPTASFSFRAEHIEWIEAEAKRRGISKSELMRELVTDAIAVQEQAA